MKSAARYLSSKLKENAHWITTKRKDVSFSPKDFEQVHGFLAVERLNRTSPLSKFVQSKQFQDLQYFDPNAIKRNKDNKNKRSVEDEKKLAKKRKKKNKIRKLKAAMSDEKRNEKRMQRRQRATKALNDLKKNYETNKDRENAKLSAMGDVVQDFELSDDE